MVGFQGVALLAVIAGVSLWTPVHACLDWPASLAKSDYSEEQVQAIVQTLDPFFSGTLFLPPAASVNTLLAANPKVPLANLLQYHLAPSLNPSDPAVRTPSGIAIKTLLDSIDNPTICASSLMPETTLTLRAAGTLTTVNGATADLDTLTKTCYGALVSISDVLQPRCLPSLGGAPAKTCNTTAQALMAMDEVAASLLVTILPPLFSGTIFVPSDAALKALFLSLSLPFPPKPNTNATKVATDLLKYHIIPSPPPAAGSTSPPTNTSTLLATARSQSLCRTFPAATLRISAPPLTITPAASDPTTPTTAIQTCRGVIHPIDSVLLPCALDPTWIKNPTAVPVINPRSPLPSPSPVSGTAPDTTRSLTPSGNTTSSPTSAKSAAAQAAGLPGAAVAALLAAAVVAVVAL